MTVIGPDGGAYEWCVNVLVGHVCKRGDPVPPMTGPDLPEVDLPTPGPDLPEVDLPETQTGPTTGTDVQAQAEARVRDDVCTEGCDACRPVQNGATTWQAYSNIDSDPRESRVSAAQYQSFVTGLPHDAAGRRSLEWLLDGYAWDGIEAPSCTLLEAKHGYDDRYLEDDWGGSAPVPLGWVIGAGIFTKMVTQAGDQVGRLQAYKPEASLRWCFSRQRPSIYFLSLLNVAGMIEPTVVWLPKPGDN